MLFLLLYHVFSANWNLTNTPRATERRTTAVKRRRKVNHLQVLPPCVSDRHDIPGEREPHCKRHSEQLSRVELKGKIFMSPHAKNVLQRPKSFSELSAAGVRGLYRCDEGRERWPSSHSHDTLRLGFLEIIIPLITKSEN